MRIIVDADATPCLTQIAFLAKQNHVECHMFCDYNHNLTLEDVLVHYISEGFQMVDIAISNFINIGDILITQDYGLACIALSRGAKAINPSGVIYTSSNIDDLLEQRYLKLLNKKRKINTKNQKKRTKEIDIKFLLNLQKLIDFTKKS